MDFLFVSTTEIDALMGLPWSHRIAYLMAIRPYMDKTTCLVGIRRRISYQSIRELLYVSPIAGVKVENISLQQARRIVKSLERSGLISLQSTDKQLILKCLLAERYQFAQNKADIRATSQGDRVGSQVVSAHSSNAYTSPDTATRSQTDTPHNSEYIIFIQQQFEKFWSLYPEKKSKSQAWQAFQVLNPNETLLNEMLQALIVQIEQYQEKQAQGIWVPPWKYPANWLAKHCWKDELSTDVLQETHYAEHEKPTTRRRNIDPFCPPTDDEERISNNVIQFRKYR